MILQKGNLGLVMDVMAMIRLYLRGISKNFRIDVLLGLDVLASLVSGNRLDKVGKEERREKNLTKEDKKNCHSGTSAHEKREIFKTYKKD